MNKKTIGAFFSIIVIGFIGYIILKQPHKPTNNSAIRPTTTGIKPTPISEETATNSENITTTALIKNIYQNNSKYYIVLDYVTIGEKNPDSNNQTLVNLNKKLRTFELTQNTAIQLIRYAGSDSLQPIVTPSELYKILKNNGEDYYALSFSNDTPTNNIFYQAYISPFSVKVTDGKLIELKQNYTE